MIIRSIRLRNFGLYAGDQCLQPSTAKDGEGPITLVGGLNGRGKTSLLEAVLLCFYGSRSPIVLEKDLAYSAYLEGLIHRGISKSEGSAVELDLEVPGEGNSLVSLRIRRSWRVTNKRASEKLQVWRDGREDPDLAANWNTYVEELIPSGVSSLFFFDGEKIAEIAEAEETSESLRVAIRSLLGLDLVDRLILDLDAVIRRNRSKEREAEGAEIVNAIEAELEQLRKTAAVLRQEIANKNNEVLRAREHLRKKEEEYFQTGGALAESRATLEQKRAQLMDELTKTRAEIVHLAAGALPLLLVTPLLAQVSAAAETALAVRQARTILPLVYKRDQMLLTKLTEFFPDFTKLDQIAKLLEADRKELEEQAAQTPAIELSAVGHGQLRAILETDSQQLREKAQSLLEKFQDIEEHLEQVEQHLLFQFDPETVNEKLADLSRAAQELAAKESEKEQLERRLKEIEGQIKAAEQRRVAAYEKYHQQLDELDEAQRTIAVALRSQQTLRVFGKQITERKIRALEEAITAAFADLIHKAGLVSSIRIHPETLQFTLYNDFGEEVPKSRLSSGEKQMLAVATLWGLARASGRELPVIIDTPMGRLDSSHRMNFVTKYLPRASHQVIVLSTDTEIVGPYLNCLKEYVGRQYLLRYDEVGVRTIVETGYFPGAEGVTA